MFQRIEICNKTLNNISNSSSSAQLYPQTNKYFIKSLNSNAQYKKIPDKLTLKFKSDALDVTEDKRSINTDLVQEQEYYTQDGGISFQPLVNSQSSKTIDFLDGKLSLLNERESSILKGIFFKNFADLSEKSQTKLQISNGISSGKFADYFKKLNKERRFHTDWIIKSKTESKRNSSNIKIANKTAGFTNGVENGTSAKRNYNSILLEKGNQKERKYGSKLMNSIFKK